jgi:hypothetical protein
MKLITMETVILVGSDPPAHASCVLCAKILSAMDDK